MGQGVYTFRAAAPEDLTLLGAWLRTPEVALWWGDPEAQLALLQEDLNDPRMVMRIVSLDGRPFACAQDYAVHTWPQPHLADLPAATRAIDAFIGEPDMIGQGYGSAFLRLLAERLLAEGAPMVAIDPDVQNVRARRAYEKAGFRARGEVESGEGLAVLMIFCAEPPEAH